MITRLIGWILGGSKWPILICIGIAASAGAAAGGWAGATVATWRADSSYGKKIIDLTIDKSILQDDNAQLKLAIEKQNSANEVAKAQSEAASAAQAQAERHAMDLAVFSKSRMDKLQQSFAEATDCDAVLKRYWEIRQ